VPLEEFPKKADNLIGTMSGAVPVIKVANSKRPSYSSVMLRQRTMVERIIGAILPVCLVWLFATCVFICGLHCAESDELSLASTVGAIALDQNSDCDECPINAIPVVTTQDRTSRDVYFQMPGVLSGLFSSPDSLVQRPTIATQSSYSLSADPPLKSLPGLRI